jgi:autotransporter family porin
VTGTTLDGIYALANSGASGLTIDAAAVSGGTYGIRALHNGSGELKINATGTVTGGTQAGIFANDTTSGTGVTIQAAKVYGGDRGIYAKHYGSGALSITATGTVKGTARGGILAQTDSAATGLEIRAAKVTGGTYGIGADLQGAGALSITATGAVTGTTADGIYAYSRTATNGSTIDVASVGGNLDGINSFHNGSGALSITAAGAVIGNTEDGIHALSGVATTDLTIEVAGVTGGATGINAQHYGSGALSITATGTVTGGTDLGILARNYNGTDLTIQVAAVGG